MADNPVQMRFYAVARTPDNKVKVGPDLGGRKHKSLFIVYLKRGPKFKEKTEQQKIIRKVGKYCGDIVRNKFRGGGENWTKRKLAYKICTQTIFDKAGYDISKVPSVLNEATKSEIESKLSGL